MLCLRLTYEHENRSPCRESIMKQLEDAILENYESMYRLAFTYVKNRADAEDVVQDAVVKAMASADAIRKPSSMRSYLMSVTVNTALDSIRKGKKTSDLDSVPESGREDAYENTDLARALSELDDREHAIVVLKYFEGYKLREIADALNLNENTVKTITYRALKKLRIKLEDE